MDMHDTHGLNHGHMTPIMDMHDIHDKKHDMNDTQIVDMHDVHGINHGHEWHHGTYCGHA